MSRENQVADTDASVSYSENDDVAAWKKLIASPSYGIFVECLSSLGAFVRSDLLGERLKKNGFGTCVMLGGGGAAAKDLAVRRGFRAVVPGGDLPEHIIVDFSDEMLADTKAELERLGEMVAAPVPVLVRGDFLDAAALRNLVRPPASSIWFLTGNTFGNLDEEAFAAAISRAARPGDWLVLGVDTYDPKHRDRHIARSIARYSGPEAREFFIATAPADLASHASEITVESFDARTAGQSVIPGAIAICVELGGVPVARSNRHDVDMLERWWQARGWRPLETHAGGSETYRQIVLERMNTAASASSLPSSQP